MYFFKIVFISLCTLSATIANQMSPQAHQEPPLANMYQKPGKYTINHSAHVFNSLSHSMYLRKATFVWYLGTYL